MSRFFLLRGFQADAPLILNIFDDELIVFVGLTAYDTQKLKNMAMTQPVDADGSVVRKGAILGALSLYLDFINLFLMLLRIFGQGRD